MNRKVAEDICELKLANAIVFCDIDGIFADISHRLAYGQKKEYDKFYGAIMADDEKMGLATVATYAFLHGIEALYDSLYLRLLTGRPERTRTITRMWLDNNFPNLFSDYIVSDKVMHRKDGDWRPAYLIKAELAADEVNRLADGSTRYTADNTDIYFIDDDPKIISYMKDHFLEHIDVELRDQLSTCIHPILMDPGRLPSSYEPSKSPEE